MYYTLHMSMGKRERERQPEMWVITTDLPTSASHPFYARLNQLLAEHHFDDFVEGQCQPFYAETMGSPGLPPGIYFRLLLIGYFEGINSERGIAWRASDSLALHDFLGVGLDEAPPDHSTISRTRGLIDLETHRAIFTWVLPCLSTVGLVKGKTIGIDATTLEANAALRSKAEHAIDLETGAIVGVTVQGADQGDTTTIQTTLPEAAKQLEAVATVTDDAVAVIEEIVADKGYHSRTTVHDLDTLQIRTYISEPDRGPQSWIDQEAERDAVYANRRRIRDDRGKRLLRRRGELLERPCAHLYETGGLRRAHVRGHENVLKRLLVHASAFHLGLWMRTLFGIGTPRALQGRLAALATVLSTLWSLMYDVDDTPVLINTYTTRKLAVRRSRVRRDPMLNADVACGSMA